jgi:hypothetical protein
MLIFVQDIRDPISILHAYQQALDEIVNRSNIFKIRTHQTGTSLAESVYWQQGKPELGGVIMATVGTREHIAVLVSFHQDPLRPSERAPLPAGFLKQVYLRFEDSPLPLRFTYHFNHDEFTGNYMASLSFPANWGPTLPPLMIDLAP